uniref:BTB domain-containing protein n=1 Tax=Panagrolaimus davidi TaxID=227884 RepID=A0A914PJ83_9BILA
MEFVLGVVQRLKGDYNLIASVSQDLKLDLLFVYDPKVMEMLNTEPCNTEVKKLTSNEQINLNKISKISENDSKLSKKDAFVKDAMYDEIIILEKNVTVSVETLSKKQPIVENIDTSEDEKCQAGKNATINDSVLDKNVYDEEHVPIIVSPKIPKKQLNEIILENDKQKYAQKLLTKSQNMAEATSFKTGDYVILISSDGKQIFSSASLLTRHSYIFATILKNIKKSPVKINVEEFHSDLIYSALDFLNGKNDAIIGKEIELYHFSDKYSLRDLKKAACNKFDKLLSLKNVCKIIQIAYENYFEELKLKCIEMIRLNTEKIGESKLKKLPTEIYEEIFI